MTDTKQTGRLVLAPLSPLDAPPMAPLLDYLTSSGFIGAALPGEHPGEYFIGERFLQQITFMGCSPHIELEPPADGSSFCHIRLNDALNQPVLLHGRNTQPPRCGSCRKRLPNWKDSLQEWVGSPTQSQIECPHCGEIQSAIDLGWRQSAGSGRLFLYVEDVFPGEAVPVSGFLKALEKTTGCRWHYFYIQD